MPYYCRPLQERKVFIFSLISEFLDTLSTMDFSLSAVKLQQYIYGTASCDTFSIFLEVIITNRLLQALINIDFHLELMF